MKKIKSVGLLLLLLMITQLGMSQNEIFGKWKTIDEDSGKEKSIVEIYQKDGKAYGKIIELINPEDPDATCELCTDDRKNQPVVGMEIIRAMVVDGVEWEDGTIVDPENGKVYDCRLWVEDGNLMVRGYIAFFYRTQTWLKVD